MTLHLFAQIDSTRLIEVTRGRVAMWAANRATANDIIEDQGTDLANCKEAVRWMKGIMNEADTTITVLGAENNALKAEVGVWKDKAKRRGRTIGVIAGVAVLVAGAGVVKEVVE